MSILMFEIMQECGTTVQKIVGHNGQKSLDAVGHLR